MVQHYPVIKEAAMNSAKQILVVLWSFLVLFVLTSGAVAVDEEKKTGKEMYREDCRVCHTEESQFGEYSPMSLTQDQWKKFFKEKLKATHKDVVLDREKQKLLDYLTPDKLKEIQKYCVKHAADSEQPQTCS